MSEELEYSPRRRGQHRAEDSGWDRMVATCMRFRGLGALFGGAVGTICTALLMRFFLTTRLVAVESGQVRSDTAVVHLQRDVQTMLRAECLHSTLAEQGLAGMICPVGLVKKEPS